MKNLLKECRNFLSEGVILRKSEVIIYVFCQFGVAELGFHVAVESFCLSEAIPGFICLFIALTFVVRAGYSFWKYICKDDYSLDKYLEEDPESKETTERMMLAVAKIFATVSAAREIVEKKLQNGEYDNQEEKVQPAEVLDNVETHRDLKKYVVIKRKQGEEGVSLTGEFVFETNDLSEARKELAIRAKEYSEDLFTVYCLDGYVGYLDKEENGER